MSDHQAGLEGVPSFRSVSLESQLTHDFGTPLANSFLGLYYFHLILSKVVDLQI